MINGKKEFNIHIKAKNSSEMMSFLLFIINKIIIINKVKVEKVYLMFASLIRYSGSFMVV